MLGNPETGLPLPRVQADIADQLLRTGEAAHIAYCCHETGATIRLTPVIVSCRVTDKTGHLATLRTGLPH